MMTTPTIHIIGASIAGLTLSRCLRKYGLPVILYDRNAYMQKDKSTSGLTLQARVYGPLSALLDMSEQTFCRELSIKSALEKNGFQCTAERSRVNGQDHSIRFRRSKLEELLREGLDIRWNSTLTGARVMNASATTRSTLLSFNEDDQQFESELVIGCEGIHSRLRQSLFPETQKLNILPFVVITGTRHIEAATYREIFEAHFANSCKIHVLTANAVRLEMWLEDVTKEDVKIRYTYSRPAQSSGNSSVDHLYKPDRPKSAATEIPEEFYVELDALHAKGLPRPFSDVFAVDQVHNDRLLNWLMRTPFIGFEELKRQASNGIILLGDSLHGQPILGSEGANEAILNAMTLAKYVAESDDRNISGFLTDNFSHIRAKIEESEDRLQQLHNPNKREDLRNNL